MLIARAGDGSMRDAQSAFDQVIALRRDDDHRRGRRDGARPGAPRPAHRASPTPSRARTRRRSSSSPARAVESGYDLRLVVRELARLTRDLLVLTIDPSRVSDPEIAADAERQALLDLSRRFSGEDLMRAFDVLTKAEYEIRSSMQPRYHLEMALLRWLHLRKLVPLTDLIEQMKGGRARGPPRPARPAARPRRHAAAQPRSRREAAPAQRPPVAPPRTGAAVGRGASKTAAPRRRARRSRRRRRREAADAGAEPEAGRRRAAQGRVPRRDPQGEEVLLRHRRRAGAADRARGRQGRLRVRAAAPRAARAARPESRLARGRRDQLAGRKMSGRRRGRRRRAGAPPRRRRRRLRRAAPTSRAAAGRRSRTGAEGARPLRHRRADDARRLRRRDQRRRRDVVDRRTRPRRCGRGRGARGGGAVRGRRLER